MVNISILNLSQQRIIFIVLKFKSEGDLAKLHCCDFLGVKGMISFVGRHILKANMLLKMSIV